MGAEIVNLRRVRKARARAAETATADANRVAFGTPRALREASDLERARAERALVGQRLRPTEEEEGA